jgi:dihydroorotase
MSNDAYILRNGQLAQENTPDLAGADLFIEKGRVTAVGSALPAVDGVAEIDCTGRVILPGLFDAHVHLREPGREDKESISTGSEAAINGGVTGIVAMPNCTPAIDSAGMVQSVLDIASREARIPVYTTGCITKGRVGKELADIGGMHARGAVMITDDGDPVGNHQVLRRAMEYAREFDLIVASHCEVKELSGVGAMNEGEVSYRLGVPGIPAASEEICISRDIRLANLTGAHVHIQHVTSGEGIRTIERFKDDGVNVTCEVSPHHLFFNETHIGDYDTHYKMNPPLRLAEDNAILLDGLKRGIFDIIATDHAPHTDFEKQLDFGSAPFGITGLETALPTLYQNFIRTETFGWDLLVKRYSAEPRRLLRMEPVEFKEGAKVDLTIFNPERETVFTKEFMRSKSRNTPFLDQTVQGHVEMVILGEDVLLDRLQK